MFQISLPFCLLTFWITSTCNIRECSVTTNKIWNMRKKASTLSLISHNSSFCNMKTPSLHLHLLNTSIFVSNCKKSKIWPLFPTFQNSQRSLQSIEFHLQMGCQCLDFTNTKHFMGLWISHFILRNHPVSQKTIEFPQNHPATQKPSSFP